MSYPYPGPQRPNNDGLPFALPPLLKTRTAVSAISVLLGVTSIMGLFRVISIQIRYGMGLDPIGSLMSYSGYVVGILGALLLWVLRPAAEAPSPQFPVPGQPGLPAQPGQPGVQAPQGFPPAQPAQAYQQAAPAEVPPPPPVVGQPGFNATGQPGFNATGQPGFNYAQFDDLLGDSGPK